MFSKNYPLRNGFTDVDVGAHPPGIALRVLANGSALTYGLVYVAGVATAYRVEIDSDTIDEAQVDAIFAAWDPDVEHHKAVVIAAVDAETARRVFRGHEWPADSGKRFSLSPTAQLNTLGLYTFADPILGVFAYPYVIRTIDNLQTHDLTDAIQARAFAVHAAATINAIVSGGRAVGLAVLAATTSNEADEAAAAWLSGA